MKWQKLLVLLLPMLAACGPSSDGPPRYSLSGKVTYQGKPVPAGQILFQPDASKGNSGPGASAEIKDGEYHTLPRQGTIGGPHLATVTGFDGKPIPIPNSPNLVNPNGAPIFPARVISVDLPKDGTYDIEVPKK